MCCPLARTPFSQRPKRSSWQLQHADPNGPFGSAKRTCLFAFSFRSTALPNGVAPFVGVSALSISSNTSQASTADEILDARQGGGRDFRLGQGPRRTPSRELASARERLSRDLRRAVAAAWREAASLVGQRAKTSASRATVAARWWRRCYSGPFGGAAAVTRGGKVQCPYVVTGGKKFKIYIVCLYTTLLISNFGKRFLNKITLNYRFLGHVT